MAHATPIRRCARPFSAVASSTAASPSGGDLPRGHAGGCPSAGRGRELLARATPLPVWWAADTLLQLQVLRWLEAEHRLKTEFYTDGLIPGEAASFLVVERDEAARQRGGRILRG